MLQYTRRSEIVPTALKSNSNADYNKELADNPILTYCNWNYEKKHHLTSKKLKSIIKRFDIKKLPYYVRIFNETPVNKIQYFIDKNHLKDDDLRNIWTKVSNIKGIKLKTKFWQEYNFLRSL